MLHGLDALWIHRTSASEIRHPHQARPLLIWVANIFDTWGAVQKGEQRGKKRRTKEKTRLVPVDCSATMLYLGEVV
ncbi:hypothetical protein QQF64_002279 [Cirrhinus molitorella]|uniref:Uncharacterized protein n=1 Tax=Cirrhinus molitorella TaxID=172907 RepID=A0ABR3MPQ9_9TELE